MCVCVGMSVHVWMCGDVYLDMCVCVHVYVCVCACVCVCVCMHCWCVGGNMVSVFNLHK